MVVEALVVANFCYRRPFDAAALTTSTLHTVSTTVAYDVEPQ